MCLEVYNCMLLLTYDDTGDMNHLTSAIISKAQHSALYSKMFPVSNTSTLHNHLEK